MSDPNEQLLGAQVNPLLQAMSIVFDIPMRVTIEIGRLKLTVKEFLRLAPDSVLDLKKPAGEPFEVTVNGLPVGRGEVIAVEQSSGVRVVEVFKPSVTS